VYSVVETLQQWLAVSNVSNTNVILANYSQIDNGLAKACSDISSLDQFTYYPIYQNTISTCLQYELIFSIVIGLALGIIMLLIHCNYL